MSTSLRDLIGNLLDVYDQRKQLQSLDLETQEMLDYALDRVVDGTDPKICLVPAYRRKLYKSILTALDYADMLVDQIPDPININSSEFVNDPYLRTFFPTLEGLRKVFRQSSELHDYFSEQAHFSIKNSCALLCMRKSEETVLGMELEGERVIRDVQQTRVTFSGHRFYSPETSELAARRELKCCIFEGLVTNALAKISELRQRRAHLETQRQVLHSRLRGGSTGSNSGAATAANEQSQFSHQQLALQFEEVERELQAIGYITPDVSLRLVNETLDQPEKFVQLENLSLSVDRGGIKRDETMASPSVQQLELAEISIKGLPSRVVTLAYISRDEMERSERLSS